MNSKWVLLLLVLTGPAFARGNQEDAVFSVNGEPFLMRRGVLVDEAREQPRMNEAPNTRERYYQGGTGAARALLHIASLYWQRDAKTLADFVYEPLPSTLAVRGVRSGQLDWAVLSRDLLASEKEEGLVSTTVAWDALFVVVPVDLPVENLSLRKLAGVFTGAVSNWKDVGGPDLPILPVAYSELSGNAGAWRDLVLERVYGDDGALTARALRLDYDADIFRQVASRAGAIGFGSDTLDSVEPGPGVKFLKIDNIDHDREEIAIGRYPLARPLNFVTRGDPQGRARDLLDTLLGERVQSALAGLSLVAVN